MELKVLNKEGKETGRTVSLNDAVFGIDPNDHAIYLDVKQYLANGRQGTHKSKERGEVARTTKKHHKQKGTGGARAGSLKSPVQKGGGTAFGPRPRDYSFKLNKKVKQLARKSALSIKAKDQSIMVIENLVMESPKTQEYSKILANLGISNKKSLIVVGDYDKNVYLSSRNLQGSNVLNASELNTYVIMNSKSVVLTEGSVEKIVELLS
jgi:large subunit ribosomal protein L4